MTDVRHAVLLPEATPVGERLRIARVAARREQDECAEALGISTRTYQRIEDGSRAATARELATLAELFDQDVALFSASLAAAEGERGTVSRRRQAVKS